MYNRDPETVETFLPQLVHRVRIGFSEEIPNIISTAGSQHSGYTLKLRSGISGSNKCNLN